MKKRTVLYIQIQRLNSTNNNAILVQKMPLIQLFNFFNDEKPPTFIENQSIFSEVTKLTGQSNHFNLYEEIASSF